jgi:FAD/FMN-containing dehydrogenase
MGNTVRSQLVQIAGVANVSDDPARLEAFATDRSFAAKMPPRFVVKVENAHQVEALVKWANATQTPLVPVSSGAPHHKGDTVPDMPESVVVDLSGMKRIININRQQRMVVVEPGVTYGELQAALAKEGLTLSTSIAPRATKSAVASALELEPRLNALHQWNYTDPLRCTEVVWGDGNRMYTGEAGMGPRDLEKQWAAQKWQIGAAGPNMLDFYRLLTAAQGTMGIVTWASLKCEILPQVQKLYLVPAPRSEDLNDFVYRVLRLRFSDQLMVMNGAYLASLMGETPAKVKALQTKLPAWMALVGLVGRELLPAERVEAQGLDITEIAQQFGLKMVSAVAGVRGEQVLEKILNPSGETYWKETFKGGVQDIFFSTTLDRTPGFITRMHALAEEAGYPTQEIGVYIQPTNMGTSCHCEFSLPYCADDAKDTARMKKLFTVASEAFAGMGAYYSRPYGIWSKLQLNKDAQSAATLKTLKKTFDPNNVLNPGKLCI